MSRDDHGQLHVRLGDASTGRTFSVAFDHVQADRCSSGHDNPATGWALGNEGMTARHIGRPGDSRRAWNGM